MIMKKLIFLLCVLLLASVSFGVPDWIVSVDDGSGQGFVPWEGQDVKPSDLIQVVFASYDVTFGGFAAFTITSTNGLFMELWHRPNGDYPDGWYGFPWSEEVTQYGDAERPEGFQLVVSGSGPLGQPDPMGELFGFIFHVPDYKLPSDWIYINHTEGSFGAVFPPDVVPEIAIHVIPEPMTIALMGLGGLFLVRRKKR
jgi:hypothetical protein